MTLEERAAALPEFLRVPTEAERAAWRAREFGKADPTEVPMPDEPEVNFLRTVNGGPEMPMDDAQPAAAGGVEPDIGAPWTAGVVSANTPYGPRVILQLYTLTGQTVVGMEPAGAQKLGNELLRKAREARFGLKVIGDAGEAGGET